MKISKTFLITAISFVSLHTASTAFAQQQGPSEEQRAAFKECADSVGMVKPAKGQRPTAPTEEQRTALDACLKEKGFEPPAHFGRPGGPPPQASGGAQ